jgi:hypothetical protein
MDHAAGQAMEPPRRRPATWHESRRPGGSRHAAMRGTGRMGGPPARYIRKLPTCARCRSATCSLPEAPRREATALAPASQAQQPLGAGRPLDGTGSRSRGLEHEGGRHPPWTAAVAAASAKGHATALARRIARNSRKTRKRYAHVPPARPPLAPAATGKACRQPRPTEVARAQFFVPHGFRKPSLAAPCPGREEQRPVCPAGRQDRGRIWEGSE